MLRPDKLGGRIDFLHQHQFELHVLTNANLTIVGVYKVIKSSMNKYTSPYIAGLYCCLHLSVSNKVDD